MPDFQLKRGILAKPVSIHVEGASEAAMQVATNAVPGDAAVDIASAEIAVKQDGAPGGLPSVVSFDSVKFSAGATAQIGIVKDPGPLAGKITNGIDLADQVSHALQFAAADDCHYAYLRWTYDLAAAATGSVALGAGPSLHFSVDAERGGVFALVRQIPDRDGTGRALGCADMLGDLIQHWRLPKHVQGPESIEPGTWVVAEADGHLNAGVDIQYGYNLNWIRSVTAGTLSGEIGVKLQTGIAANLSIGVAGKHSVVISRGTGDRGNRIALRVYRMNTRSFGAGVSASANVTGVNDGLLPSRFDDFLAGIMGTDGGRIVKALKDVDSWTNPNQPLLGPLAGVTGDYLRKFFRDVTGQDLDSDITLVKTRIRTVVSTWDDLPQETTKLLWAHLPQSDVLAKIADIAGQVASAKADDVQALLAAKTGSTGFLATAPGKWLESLAVNGLFKALQSTGELATIQARAGQVASLLDGDTVQGVLQKLHDEVSARLKLDQFMKIVDQASVDNLDEWLVARLSAFLGKNPGTKAAVAELTALRDQINRLAGMRDTFYRKAIEALTNTYSFSFAASYQRTAVTDALIDAEFDFDRDPADARACLAAALDGNLDALLGGNHPGVILNQGVLTHGVRRQSVVEFSMPYFDRRTTHVNDVLGSVTAIDHGEGRLLAVTASDEITQITNKRTKRDSTLSLAMNLTAAGATGLDIVEPLTATVAYALVDTFPNMPRTRFVRDYKDYLTTYFPDEFGVPAGSVDQYAAGLAPQKDDLGDGTASLQVALQPEVVLAWLKAKDHPAKTDAIYKVVAERVLGAYRGLLLRQYFGDPRKYGTPVPAFALLAYSCVPLRFNVAVRTPDQAYKLSTDEKSEHLHWNEAQDPILVRTMVTLAETKALLKIHLERIHAFLVAERHPDAEFYHPDAAERIAGEAARHHAIAGLFNVESRLVNDIREACLSIAQFLNSSGGKKDVFGAFEDFASKLTQSFGSDLRNLWASDTALLPLGPIVLRAAASVFDPAVGALQPGAMFTVKTSNLAAPSVLVRLLPASAPAKIEHA